MKNTKLFAALCCTAMLFAACEKNEPKDTKNDTKEAVDLGLSVKWASCNLGATKPEEFGNYYAWGETTAKSEYTWETYKYGSDYDALKKYCSNASYGKDGFSDELTALSTSDDAATKNWGSNWRMPTIDEWNELITKCTWKWTAKNGVKGYKVSKNGKYIFLPAAGVYDDDELYYPSYGYYWSSSLNADFPSNAQNVILYSDGHATSTAGSRYWGLPVRPVCK